MLFLPLNRKKSDSNNQMTENEFPEFHSMCQKKNRHVFKLWTQRVQIDVHFITLTVLA